MFYLLGKLRICVCNSITVLEFVALMIYVNTILCNCRYERELIDYAFLLHFRDATMYAFFSICNLLDAFAS